MKPKYKLLLIRLAITIGIDIVLLSIFIIWMQAKPNYYYSTIEILLLMGIFVINIGLAIASKYVIRKLYLPLILNSVIAILIFHLLLKSWYTFQDSYVAREKFEVREKHYELTLDKRDTSYSFFQIYNRSSTELMRGQYKISNDSIYLIDPLNQMIVYRDSLIGFSKDKVPLKKE